MMTIIFSCLPHQLSNTFPSQAAVLKPGLKQFCFFSLDSAVVAKTKLLTSAQKLILIYDFFSDKAISSTILLDKNKKQFDW